MKIAPSGIRLGLGPKLEIGNKKIFHHFLTLYPCYLFLWSILCVFQFLIFFCSSSQAILMKKIYNISIINIHFDKYFGPSRSSSSYLKKFKKFLNCSEKSDFGSTLSKLFLQCRLSLLLCPEFFQIFSIGAKQVIAGIQS